MELNYRNCKALLTEIGEGNYSISIFFGETEIYKDLTAKGRDMAKKKAKQLIDGFIGDLPPALSYKHYNNASN